MIKAEVDMTGFTKGMNGLINKLGLSAKKVMRKETGELIKTLVKISPPAQLNQAKSRMEGRIDFTFDTLGENTLFSGKGEASKKYPGTIWTHVDSDRLKGIAQRNDMRKASIDDIRAMYLRTKIRNGSAKQVFQFNPPRKHQRVEINQRVITTKAKIAALKRRFVKNLGRLKAGWLVSVFKGDIAISGDNMPPKWVTRHADGARGNRINELDRVAGKVPSPRFTIINTAKGIGQRGINFMAQKALNIRAKAMSANVLMFAKGKKPLSAYA